jgi:hypothetical protein
VDKDTATEVKNLALNAIESFGKIIRLPGIRNDEDAYPKILRAVGSLIGETEVMLLGEIYKIYPELDDLK